MRPSPSIAERLPIVDHDADREFSAALADASIARGRDWAEGYVDYEWNRARHLFKAVIGEDLSGCSALEVGCYVGGTATVLAKLGARVTAIDADPRWLPVARLNAQRYGAAARVELRHVRDLGALPFEAGRFRLVCCNSILEYLPEGVQKRVIAEIHRVLAHGGTLMILGSSNRCWPRENHSGRWLVNYLPQSWAWKSEPGVWCARSIWPWQITRALPGYVDRLSERHGAALIRAKQDMGVKVWKVALLRRAARVLSATGVPVGALGPTLTIALQKPLAA